MKIVKVLFCISMVLLLCGYTQNAISKTDIKKDIGTEYKKETFSDIERVLDNCAFNFSKNSCTFAIDFAKKLKYVYRNKDFETLANIIPYPITITETSASGEVKRSIEIKSKQEFLNLDKEKIMNNKIFKAINKNSIFVNYQGFMLGNGEIWWFQENDKSSEFSLNILEY